MNDTYLNFSLESDSDHGCIESAAQSDEFHCNETSEETKGIPEIKVKKEVSEINQILTGQNSKTDSDLLQSR